MYYRRSHSKSPTRRGGKQWKIWNCPCGNTPERDYCLGCGKAYWETDWTWWTKDQVGRDRLGNKPPRQNAWANGPPQSLQNQGKKPNEFHANSLKMLQDILQNATEEHHQDPQTAGLIRYIQQTLEACRKEAPIEERRRRLKSVQDKLQAKTQTVDRLTHRLLELEQQMNETEDARTQAITEKETLEKEYQQALEDARTRPEEEEADEGPKPTVEEFLQQQNNKRMRVDQDALRMAAGLAQYVSEGIQHPVFPDSDDRDMADAEETAPYGILSGG